MISLGLVGRDFNIVAHPPCLLFCAKTNILCFGFSFDRVRSAYRYRWLGMVRRQFRDEPDRNNKEIQRIFGE